MNVNKSAPDKVAAGNRSRNLAHRSVAGILSMGS